jgi:hypothetical protein
MVDQFSLVHKLPRHKGLYRLYRFYTAEKISGRIKQAVATLCQGKHSTKLQ